MLHPRAAAEQAATLLLPEQQRNEQLRQALARREAEIDRLRFENKELRARVERSRHLEGKTKADESITIINHSRDNPTPWVIDKPKVLAQKREAALQEEDLQAESGPAPSKRPTGSLAWSRVLQILGLSDADTIQTEAPAPANYPASFPDPPSSQLPAFTTRIRRHATMRMRSYSHGQALTARDDSGGWRFTWFPSPRA